MKKTKSLFKLSATAFGILHLTNIFIDSNNAATTTSKNNGKYYHWKHGDIFYKVMGEGDPILLIHDMTVYSSSYEWNQIVESLSSTHKVYILDMIGCGKSDKPAIIYTNYFCIQLISDFIKDIIGEKTAVAATGLSTNIVLMANSIHSDLFKEMILVSPKSISYSRKMPDERSKILIRLFNLPIIGKTAYYVVTCKSNVEYYLSEKCVYNPFKLKKSTILGYYNAAHTGNGNGRSLLASLEGYYLNADITNALKNAAVPITLIHGTHNENALEIEKSYCRINENITICHIKDAKLLPQIECPQEFLKCIK